MLPERGTIPENAPGLSLYGGRTPSGSRGTVGLEELTGSGPVALTLTETGQSPAVIAPSGGFRAGTRYRLTAADPCEAVAKPPTVAEFDVGPAAPLPTSLGAVRLVRLESGGVTVATSGLCSEVVTASGAEVELELDAGAAPWKDLLAYETLVDGKPWRPSSDTRSIVHPAGSWTGRGRDLVFAKCEGPLDGGLASGKHTVTFRATLGGANLALESAPIEVDLSCPQLPPPSGVEEDRMPNVSQEEPDAPSHSGAAGCSMQPGSASLWGAWLIVAGAIAAACRARRGAR